VRFTVAALFAGLAVGIAAGLAWPETESPRDAIVARLESRVTAYDRRVEGRTVRTVCTPVRGSGSDYSCYAIRHEGPLGSSGIYYHARVDWRTGRFRFSRFDVPLYWGV
jgi:hypothetical protein